MTEAFRAAAYPKFLTEQQKQCLEILWELQWQPRLYFNNNTGYEEQYISSPVKDQTKVELLNKVAPSFNIGYALLSGVNGNEAKVNQALFDDLLLKYPDPLKLFLNQKNAWVPVTSTFFGRQLHYYVADKKEKDIEDMRRALDGLGIEYIVHFGTLDETSGLEMLHVIYDDLVAGLKTKIRESAQLSVALDQVMRYADPQYFATLREKHYSQKLEKAAQNLDDSVWGYVVN